MNESENMSLQEEQFPDEPSAIHSYSTQEEGNDAADKESLGNEEQHKKDKTKKEKDGHTVQFEAFLADLDKQANAETKLQLAIQFMEQALSQGGTPHFRNFWEARRLCLPLFKETLSPALRSQLWIKYSDLSKEARRLKELLDEQSSFAVEQIEMAIQALEVDIQKNAGDKKLEELVFDENTFPCSLKVKHPFYQDVQQELNILNVEASRINALRKELLKTEMRVRQKNKFFQRLSAAGDKVFPRRKELIKQISIEFLEDVDHFIQSHFKSDLGREALYQLREEIKALQGLAKVLTLNTSSFTQTRTRLSECWDKLKQEEKERKKERAQQRTVFKQNAEAVQEQIQAFKNRFAAGELNTADAQKELDQIATFMRRVELGRDELKELKEGLGEARQALQNKLKAEEDVRHQQEQERNRQKRERFNAFKAQAEELIKQHEQYEAEQLIEQKEQLLKDIQDSPLIKSEKQELERLLKPLRDIITDKKEKAMLNLSEDDRQALQQLKDILQQRKERRQEIKNQLEFFRKASSTSGLDFEKAMNYHSQMDEEKQRLEKVNQGIKEIEQKLAQLQSKIKG